mmetsp:Transcript_7445/g.24356  ORF Transcript_7445/g.24356 Transcript_7445/m.24356 type:complete len:463 (+) Transcript_7445:24-1412(+)
MWCGGRRKKKGAASGPRQLTTPGPQDSSSSLGIRSSDAAKPEDAAAFKAADCLAGSRCDLEAVASALRALAQRPADARPSDPAAWLAGLIGPALGYRMTLENLLDIVHIVGGEPVCRAALAAQELHAEADRVRSIAEARGGECSGDALANALANLRAVSGCGGEGGGGKLTPHLAWVISRVLALLPGWSFASDGDVDRPPLCSAADCAVTLSPLESMDMKRLLFAAAPPAFLDFGRICSLREDITFATATFAPAPVAVVTVGAPGAGKSKVLLHNCLPYLGSHYNAPAETRSYAHIDPDLFITQLCLNDNAHRGLANFCNHESFLTAVGQRRNLLFDGTGKDLLNTCGRVISRLKAAGYRIFMCVVCTTYSTCLRRIAAREAVTGRSVPPKFVRMALDGMRTSIPVYLERQPQLAEAILLWDNEHDEEDSAPSVVVEGGGAPARTAALDLVQSSMAVPEELV